MKYKSYTDRMIEEQEKITEFNAKIYLKILLSRLLWITVTIIDLLLWLVFGLNIYYNGEFNFMLFAITVGISLVFILMIFINFRKRR